MKKFIAFMMPVVFLLACGPLTDASQDETSSVSQARVDQLILKLVDKHGSEHQFRIERGVNQAATLWRNSDGSMNDFEDFVSENFIADPKELDMVFDRLANNFKFLYG
ncbi:MAG TPA: hypothetical protein ENN08_04420 [Bacteroidales bacterium]|nr:hypothetical protein [Bacteroidales bacterium]